MRTFTLCCVALAAVACDASDRTTAPRAPGAPSADISVGPTQPLGSTGYTLTDISGGLASSALDINASGTIVGRHTVNGAEHGFVRHADGTVQDLPPLPGDASNVASGVNASDVVVGSSTSADGHSHAWRKAPGGPMTRLYDAPCGSRSHANAIDAAGEIVGDCNTIEAVWTTPTDDPLLGSPVLFGTMLDVGHGLAVGYAAAPGDDKKEAVAWDGEHAHTILTLPAGTTSTWFTGAVSAQEVVGGYTDASGDHGFVTILGATPRLLPHPVQAMTALGRIVGWYVSIPAVAYTIAPNGSFEVPLPPTNRDRVAFRANRCGAIVGHYFPYGLQGGPRAALWSKPTCD